ncbi:SNF7 family protein [Besnoitia besnoiti]|uniref:SNF7 family protein n=1 Tax=Besnoitia besnoiti TaxID=94643 RepID=A0A2A9MG47_BESBE|nr:SNF7 family protein [Besnoitia besnoiti]PFH35251.1 SNF7 family protein [Besnoitia besnoiti]
MPHPPERSPFGASFAESPAASPSYSDFLRANGPLKGSAMPPLSPASSSPFSQSCFSNSLPLSSRTLPSSPLPALREAPLSSSAVLSHLRASSTASLPPFASSSVVSPLSGAGAEDATSDGLFAALPDALSSPGVHTPGKTQCSSSLRLSDEKLQAIALTDPLLLDFVQELEQLSPEQKRFFMSPYLPARDRTPAAAGSPFQESKKLEFWKKACHALCRLRESPAFPRSSLSLLLPALLETAACPWTLMDPERILQGLCDAGAICRVRDLEQEYFSASRRAVLEARSQARREVHERRKRQADQPPAPPASVLPSASASSVSACGGEAPSAAFAAEWSERSAASLLSAAWPFCRAVADQLDRAALRGLAALSRHAGAALRRVASAAQRRKCRRVEDAVAEKKRRATVHAKNQSEDMCICSAAMEEYVAEFAFWLRFSETPREKNLIEDDEGDESDGGAEEEAKLEKGRSRFLLPEEVIESFWASRWRGKDASSAAFSFESFLGFLLSRRASASRRVCAALCALPVASRSLNAPASSSSSAAAAPRREEKGEPCKSRRSLWIRLGALLSRRDAEAPRTDPKTAEDEPLLMLVKITINQDENETQARRRDSRKGQSRPRSGWASLLKSQVLAAARAGDRKTAVRLLRFLRQIELRREEADLLLFQVESSLGSQARVRSLSVVASALAENEQILRSYQRSSAAVAGATAERLAPTLAETRELQAETQRVADTFEVFAYPGVASVDDDVLNAELAEIEKQVLEEKTAALLSTLPAVPQGELSPTVLRSPAQGAARPFLPRVALLPTRKRRDLNPLAQSPVDRRNLTLSALRRSVSPFARPKKKRVLLTPPPPLGAGPPSRASRGRSHCRPARVGRGEARDDSRRTRDKSLQRRPRERGLGGECGLQTLRKPRDRGQEGTLSL